MQKNIVFTFASLITLGLTLLVITLYFNGIDIVEDDLFTPIIMLGILLTFYFISKVDSSKLKRIGLGKHLFTFDFRYVGINICLNWD
jgi:hypothetical protein